MLAHYIVVIEYGAKCFNPKRCECVGWIINDIGIFKFYRDFGVGRDFVGAWRNLKILRWYSNENIWTVFNVSVNFHVGLKLVVSESEGLI